VKKLYEVTIEFPVYVMAESVADALYVGHRYARDELSNLGDATTNAKEVKDARELESEYLHSPPYGGDGETTCKQLLGTRR
jgi:hypothetical protein